MVDKIKKAISVLLILCGAFVVGWYVNRHYSPPQPISPVTPNPTPQATFVNLAVPFIFEAVDQPFKKPWNNACEEASITMIQNFYAGNTTVTAAAAKEFMQMLFDKEDATWGSNANTDAARTAELMNKYTSYTATIKDNPTIDDIKNELRAGHPVMSFHYGYDLHNRNIPFAVNGSYYHTMVIKGFDDEHHQWITNDDGDEKTGKDHRYDYDQFMNSLHDYVFATNKANGTPRVIFTKAK